MQQPTPDAPSPGADLPNPEVQRFLDLSSELILQLDPNERVTLVNRSLLQALGFEAADLLGHDWFDACLPEEDREASRVAFHQLLQPEAPPGGHGENRVLTKDGEVRHVHWRYSKLVEPTGRVVGMLASGEDITAARQAQSDLARAQRQLETYRFALDSSSIVAITDRRGRIVHVNDQQCEVSRYEREELLGQDHRILNSGYHSKAFFKNLWATIKEGRIWRGDIRNRAKDGSMYWVSTTIVPFLDEDGQPEHYIAIRNEITDRKVAEAALERTVRELSAARGREAERSRALAAANEELRRAQDQLRAEQAKLLQAEKLSSIGHLAAGVAHEINNPLSGVMACVKALEDESLRGPRRREYFDAAREGLVRIEQTVQGLLEYASQRPPTPSPTSCRELAEACLRLLAPLARERGVRVVVRELDEGAIEVDRPQLMQAFMNVLLNAIYVSEDGAAVTVSTEAREGQVGLRVRDDGPGMADDVVRRACDPFFSTKPEGEGTGLGLAVTLSILQAHGGDIDFDTALGRGTAVTLWLPMEGANRSVRA